MHFLIGVAIFMVLIWVALFPGFLVTYYLLPEFVRLNRYAVWLSAAGSILIMYAGIYYFAFVQTGSVAWSWYEDKKSFFIYSFLVLLVFVSFGTLGPTPSYNSRTPGNIWDWSTGEKPYTPRYSLHTPHAASTDIAEADAQNTVDGQEPPAQTTPAEKPHPVPPFIVQQVMTEVFNNFDPKTRTSNVGAGAVASIFDMIKIKNGAEEKWVLLFLNGIGSLNGSCSGTPCPSLKIGAVIITIESERAKVLGSNLSLEETLGLAGTSPGSLIHVGKKIIMAYKYSTYGFLDNSLDHNSSYLSFAEIDANNIQWIGKIEVGGDNCDFTRIRPTCGYEWSASATVEKSPDNLLPPDLILTYSGTNSLGINIDGRQTKLTYKNEKYSMEGDSSLQETPTQIPPVGAIGSKGDEPEKSGMQGETTLNSSSLPTKTLPLPLEGVKNVSDFDL